MNDRVRTSQTYKDMYRLEKLGVYYVETLGTIEVTVGENVGKIFYYVHFDTEYVWFDVYGSQKKVQREAFFRRLIRHKK